MKLADKGINFTMVISSIGVCRGDSRTGKERTPVTVGGHRSDGRFVGSRVLMSGMGDKVA